MRRDDKETKTYFRSERIFCMNGSWYFATREGEQGPFFSRTRAEDALKRFLGDKRELAAFQKSRHRNPESEIDCDVTAIAVPAALAGARKPLIF